jgi:hypothetical protein
MHATNTKKQSMMLPPLMLLLLLLLLVVVVQAAAAPQTAVQQAVSQRTRVEAKQASAAAHGRLAQLIAMPATRRFLEALTLQQQQQTSDAVPLCKRSSADLAAQFYRELAVAELVHNFGDGASADANCGFDVSLPTTDSMPTNNNNNNVAGEGEGEGEADADADNSADAAAAAAASSVFYNQWELQALGMTPVDAANNGFTEWSETQLFGFPPFRNVAAPDLRTARDRPVYGALNMYRSAGGNPQCGPVAAVFRRGGDDDAAAAAGAAAAGAIQDSELLASPLDTGFFQGSCAAGQRVAEWGHWIMARCSAWPAGAGNRTLGSPPYVEHLVETYVRFFNATETEAGPTDYPFLNLARLLVRLLSRDTYASKQQAAAAAPLSLNFVENTLGYFELNVAASVQLRGGIKMMVGMFELLFGTARGAALRRWCIARGWALAWAYNPAMSYFRCGPAGDAPGCRFPASLSTGIDTAAVRVLDPVVLFASSSSSSSFGHNVSVSDAVQSRFAALWLAVNASSDSHAALDRAWHDGMLSPSSVGVLQSALAVEPLYAGACANTRDCVGVSIVDATCVCPQQASKRTHTARQ